MDDSSLKTARSGRLALFVVHYVNWVHYRYRTALTWYYIAPLISQTAERHPVRSISGVKCWLSVGSQAELEINDPILRAAQLSPNVRERDKSTKFIFHTIMALRRSGFEMKQHI